MRGKLLTALTRNCIAKAIYQN